MTQNQKTTKTPSRCGFYMVTSLGQTFVAEWNFAGATPKSCQWWRHVSDDPTILKKPVAWTGEVTDFRAATKDEASLALKRELTRDEQIEKAYGHYVNHAEIYPRYTHLPGLSRQLEIGERVEYGNLKDCVVADIREEGRVVIMVYHNIERSYGKEIDHGVACIAAHWTSVFSKKYETQTTRTCESLLTGAFTAQTIESLIHSMINGLSGDVDFQRDYVWSDEDQQRYLDTLMQGRDLGKIVIVRMPFPQSSVLLDGKQRMNCLMGFVRSEISWRGLFWHELSRLDRSKLMDRTVHVATVEAARCTLVERLKMFLEINASGVPQTEEHLQKVRDLLAKEESRIASLGAMVRS